MSEPIARPPVDDWWNAPAPAPVDIGPRTRGAAYLDARLAAARVELVARRAIADDPAAARAALEWYADAWRFAAGLARAYGISVEAAAGAIAALSPQVSWDVQVSWAPAILDAWRAGLPGLPGPGYARNKTKARRILDGAAPLDVLGGPKVRAFYRCIVSGGADPGPVCVDRHAWHIAAGLRDGAGLTAARYCEAADAYREAARELARSFPDLAITPARLQALTWVWWRDNADRRF